MEKFKYYLNRFVCPSATMGVMLVILTIVGLVYVFATGSTESMVAYIIYPVSAYTLAIVVFFFVRFFTREKENISAKINSNKMANKLIHDLAFRVRVSLYNSLVINTLYAVANFVAGVIYKSVWLGAVSVFYIVLSVLRYLLLHHVNIKLMEDDIVKEHKKARLCGIILFLLNIAFIGMVVQMVRDDRGAVYPGLLIYVAATFTFYSLVVAIVNLVKYRKFKSPVFSASKIVSMISALVSIMSLQTAMLTQFETENPNFPPLMNAITGAGIFITVCVMAIFMIVKSNKALKGLEPSNI